MICVDAPSANCQSCFGWAVRLPRAGILSRKWSSLAKAGRLADSAEERQPEGNLFNRSLAPRSKANRMYKFYCPASVGLPAPEISDAPPPLTVRINISKGD